MEKITETTKATEVEEAVSSQETIPQQEEPQEEKAQFDKELFKRSVLYNILTMYRKTLEEATPQQIFQAASYSIKDRVIGNWMTTQKAYEKEDPKTVYYMSMEFLMGRALGNNMINLGAYQGVKEVLEELGVDINVIEDQEPDAALGNGGLGRLAACFLDSLATLGYPAYGCGIRYHYGMFKQEIRDGFQVEVPDNWLADGNPFELRRPEYAKVVKFGGYVSVRCDENGRNNYVQEGYQAVRAIPYDLPIVGYENGIVNTLRIWDAESMAGFKLDSFDKGDYSKAVEEENLARNLVDVLYPNDNHYAGKELRLKQQYFFISASVQEAVEKYMRKHDDIHKFYEKVTFQLNDTHPTVAIPELMRILLDEYYLTWDEAWEITTKTCAYTNHTIMAEALEKWPIDLFSRLLPRIYQIVEEINASLQGCAVCGPRPQERDFPEQGCRQSCPLLSQQHSGPHCLQDAARDYRRPQGLYQGQQLCCRQDGGEQRPCDKSADSVECARGGPLPAADGADGAEARLGVEHDARTHA